MFLNLILAASISAPPDPAVVNAWVNPPARDYPACRSHVESGGKAVLAVGVDTPPGAYCVAKLEGFLPGLYECFSEAGVAKMKPLAVPKQMQPAKQFVRQCVNGTCTLIEVTQ